MNPRKGDWETKEDATETDSMATLRSTCSVRYCGSMRGKSKGLEEANLRVPPV